MYIHIILSIEHKVDAHDKKLFMIRIEVFHVNIAQQNIRSVYKKCKSSVSAYKITRHETETTIVTS